MAGSLSGTFSTVLLRGITDVLESLGDGAGGRVRLCEAAAGIFGCTAAGHAWADCGRHGWSVCLWRQAVEGARAVTLSDSDPEVPADPWHTWWPASLCRRVALDWLDQPHLAEVPLVGDPACCSVLLLAGHHPFGHEDTRRVNLALRPLRAVERTVLRIEPPVLPGPGQGEALTEREAEVLRLLGEGLLARSIAQRMTVSERTVHKHLGNVYRKLGVHDRLLAVARGQELGLLPRPGA